jgi:aldehyde dehydrogenase (NAD+)
VTTHQIDARQEPSTLGTDRDRIRALFEAQQAHRWTMALTTASERIERLDRLRDAIVRSRDELDEALKADLHKHAAEIELTELQPALVEIGYTIKHLRRWMRPRSVGTPLTLFGTRSEVIYEPKGVVLVLAPWNYPFNLMINPLVAAIAAGNCAMLKPSEKTPNVSHYLARLVAEVFDEREVALVEGDAETASALLDLPFDHIFFTGSSRIGRIVMEAAARHLASVTLELGGKSPVIVAEDADLDRAARRVVWGKFLNAGQTCVAPDYVLVAASREREFVAKAAAAVADFYGPTEEDRRRTPDLCRVVDKAAAERLGRLVDDACARGAHAETGAVVDPAERYVAPTILSGVDPDSRIMQEEIFGPVLPVIAYRTLDEALAIVHRHGKPLALYVFSENDATVDRIIRDTTAGGTAVNNVVLHFANPNLPFGGTGESGTGSYHGEYGFRAFSHERAILRQGFAHTFHHFYPPYTDRVHWLLALVTRWVRR